MKIGRLFLNNSEKLIVLDTHVWIWLMEGVDKNLSLESIKGIEEAAKDSNIYISAISVWEVAMLEAKTRIHFNIPCSEWVDKAIHAPGINLFPLRPDVAIESTRLPGNFHGDPADRIITASARILNASLITRDKKILEYSKSGYVKSI